MFLHELPQNVTSSTFAIVSWIGRNYHHELLQALSKVRSSERWSMLPNSLTTI